MANQTEFEKIANNIMGAFQGDETLNDADLFRAAECSRADYQYVRDELIDGSNELLAYESGDGEGVIYKKLQPLAKSVPVQMGVGAGQVPESRQKG